MTVYCLFFITMIDKHKEAACVMVQYQMDKIAKLCCH